LRELADNTDGASTVNSTDLALGLRRVVEHTSAYYLLGYSSTNTARDGRYREIDVHVNRSGVRVTARRGYTDVSAAAQQLGNERAARVTVPLAVAEAFGSLARLDAPDSLRAIATARDDFVDVVAEIGPREFDEGPWRAGADLSVELVSEGGASHVTAGRLAPNTPGLWIAVPVASDDAGPWRVYVRARSGERDLTTRVTVATRERSKLGPPRVFRVPAIGRAVPHPVALPLYRRGERLRIEWHPAARPVSRRVQLVDRRGQTLSPGAALADTFDPAGGTLVVDLHIAALAAGDYAIDVSAGDDGEAERQVVAFRVER
jgi:hypothetical protein